MTPYTKQIVELHKIHKAVENCGCNKDDEQGGGDENNGNLLMSLIPNEFPKPTLFLYKDSEDNFIDVTNYKINNLLSLAAGKEDGIVILCLYESSNLSSPITIQIEFTFINYNIAFNVFYENGNIETVEISYNNKVYYQYQTQES